MRRMTARRHQRDSHPATPRLAEVAAIPGQAVRLSSDDDRPELFLLPAKAHYFGAFRHLVAEISQYTCYAPFVPENDVVDRLSVENLVPESCKTDPTGPTKGPLPTGRILRRCLASLGRLPVSFRHWVKTSPFLASWIRPTPRGWSRSPRPFVRECDEDSQPSRTSVFAVCLAVGRENRRLVPSTIAAKGYGGIAPDTSRYADGLAISTAALCRTRDTFPDSCATWTTRCFETDVTHGLGDLPQAGLDVCCIPGLRNEADCEGNFLSPPHAAVFAKRLQLAIMSREQQSE